MNHVEERLFLLHFWIWERHLILLILPCCCNVFIHWVSAVLKFNGSPQWSCPALLLWLGTCFGGNPWGSALGPLLLLIYVNDMFLQIQNGSLVQFTDDTCLICCSDDHTQVKHFLSSDYKIYHYFGKKLKVSIKEGIKSCRFY